MQIETANPFGALSEERLTEFEATIGYSLPPDYRAFLLLYNGGTPQHHDFPTPDKPWGGTVHHVYGLHNGPAYLRLDHVYSMYRDRIPSVLLPIAADPGGNAICLGLVAAYRDHVYFWDHEFEDDPPTFDNVSQIAPSFTAFLARLFTYVDPDESDVERILRINDIDGLYHLLQSGLDIEMTDHYGRTLIENAAIHNRATMVEILYTRGARLRQSLRYAQQNSHHDVMQMIQMLRVRNP